MNDLSLSLVIQVESKEVQAVVSLINSSKEELIINTRFAVNTITAPAMVRELSFKIIGPKGVVGFIAKVNAPPMSNLYVKNLKSGESIQTIVPLTTYYQFSDLGKYIVEVTYENNLSFSDTLLWKGTITSNEAKLCNSDE
jgi:hypothetical protein